MNNIKFGYRRHCGGLKESLETIVYVSETTFNKFLPQYDFYAFDGRCNQILFIIKNEYENLTTYGRFWLFIEVN